MQIEIPDALVERIRAYYERWNRAWDDAQLTRAMIGLLQMAIIEREHADVTFARKETR